jgi:hypothetical protein
MALVLRRHRDHYGEDHYGEQQYLVFSGRLIVGVIELSISGPSGQRFSWAINGVDPPQTLTATHGYALTLEDAKAEFAASWRKWLAYAGLKEEDDARPPPPA